jgi:predicted esterase
MNSHSKKTILLGFSQGACLATEFAARHPQKMGGVVALSGGLIIGPDIDESNYNGLMEQTPVFLGCSDQDPHIAQKRIEETEQLLKKLGAHVTKKIYPGMGHTVNQDEIETVREMMAGML